MTDEEKDAQFYRDTESTAFPMLTDASSPLWILWAPEGLPKEHAARQSDDGIGVTSMEQAFEILGVTEEYVTMADIKSAYGVRMAENHPDKAAHMRAAFRELAAANPRKPN